MLIIFISVMVSCAAVKDLVKKPTVKFRQMSISAITLSDINLKFDFDLINPNGFGITLTDYNYQLDVNAVKFLTGDQGMQTAIPAKGMTTFSIPVTINYQNLFKTVASLVGQDEVGLQVQGNVSIKTPITPFTIPFSKSETIPLFKKPDINITSLKMKDVTLWDTKLVLDLEIKNPNVISLDINTLKHKFSISGNKILETQISEVMSLQKKGVSTLSIPITVNFKELGSAIKDVLAKGNVDYRFEGEMALGLPGGPVKMPFDRSGSIKITK